jgi:hypothetical protein
MVIEAGRVKRVKMQKKWELALPQLREPFEIADRYTEKIPYPLLKYV